MIGYLLAGGGSVAVAVGVSDMLQVTPNTDFFGIGATIRTRQELQCLPYTVVKLIIGL